MNRGLMQNRGSYRNRRSEMPNYIFSLHLLYCVLLCISLLAPAKFSEAVFVANSQAILPLPGGCGGVTPPGEEAPSCCLSGFVYGDGQPLADAELRIDAANGSSITTSTRIHAGNETRPYYHLSLNTPDLSINPGDTITVTAQYSGHKRSIRYLVQHDGQQLDLVLASNQQHDYLFQQHIGDSSNLVSPRAVAYDSQSRMYILDTNASRVKVFASNGSLLNEWGSTGSQSGQLNQPAGIAMGAGDIVYIADTQNHRIQSFSSAGSWISTLGSHGNMNGQLNNPHAIAIDAMGTLYIADTDNNRIQKFSSSGTWLASWGSLGAAAGQFDGPSGIALDQQGNIYISDRFNNRIQKLDTLGNTLKSWGSYGSAVGQLIEPRGIAVDNSGNIYVADSGNDRVQKFSTNGDWLASWGASGITEGLFATIYGLAVSNDQSVLVADAGNQRVGLFRPMTMTRPIATISKLSGQQLAADESLTAIGLGADSDTTQPISGYRWTSDRQGVLAETATFTSPANKLLSGEHVLSFAVRDAQGEWSDSVSIQIVVAKPNPHPTPTHESTYQVFLPAIVH